jgi:RES domain-containing protein
MLTAWRIVQRRHAQQAFTGEGARLYGGRWNSPGVPLVYTAGSQSLAALELLVHLESAEPLLSGYVVFEVRFATSLLTAFDRSQLPRNWREYQPPRNVQSIGGAWAAGGRSVVLQFPSATVPAENIFLLNPRHPDFSRLRIGNPAPFHFDPRLSKR